MTENEQNVKKAKELWETQVLMIKRPEYCYFGIGMLALALVLAVLKSFGVIGISWAMATAPAWVLPASFALGILILASLVVVALGMFLVVTVGYVVFLFMNVLLDIPVLVLLSTLYSMGILKDKHLGLSDG